MSPSKPLSLPPREVLFSVFDRKLCSLWGVSRVKAGKGKDEVLQRGAKVIADLSNKDAELRGDRDWRHREADQIRSIRVEIGETDLFVRLPERFNLPFQISKVFSCPTNPLESAVKQMD